MSVESKVARAVPIPVDMYIPTDPSKYVPWGTPLNLHFTESCWVDTDKPDAFGLPDGEEMPDGVTMCAGSFWGPGMPQDGYQGSDVTIITSAPEPGVCDHSLPSATDVRGGAHIIHIGSSVSLTVLLESLYAGDHALAGTWSATKTVLTEVLTREGNSLPTEVRRFLRDLIYAGDSLER